MTTVLHATIPATDGELEIYEADDGTFVFLPHPNDPRWRDISFTRAQLFELAAALGTIATKRDAGA